MKMVQREYTLRFQTPAFLGNAEQSGQWRTPPFKAQLRQWWRVAYSASKGFRVDVARMREDEGKLLGNAWLDKNFCKSLVRMRLGEWNPGKLKSWQGLEQGKVEHPEVERSHHSVGPHAYLGFGPLDGRDGTTFSKKINAAIQAGEQNVYSIAYPVEHASLIRHAISLMDQFGTVGGRSRNGWGSYCLEAVDGDSGLPLRPWEEAISLDWPHAIGTDSRGALIWQTPPRADWRELMKDLAVIKIGLRTQFKFPHAKPDGDVHQRHWLSYPVTTHRVGAWDRNNARLPNSLRFKVRPAADGRVVGVIFHMPCLPPPAFLPRGSEIVEVWKKVHGFLDGSAPNLTRVSA